MPAAERRARPPPWRGTARPSFWAPIAARRLQEHANRHPTGQAARARPGVKQRQAPWNEVSREFEQAAGGGEAKAGDNALAPADLGRKRFADAGYAMEELVALSGQSAPP